MAGSEEKNDIYFDASAGSYVHSCPTSSPVWVLSLPEIFILPDKPRGWELFPTIGTEPGLVGLKFCPWCGFELPPASRLSQDAPPVKAESTGVSESAPGVEENNILQLHSPQPIPEMVDYTRHHYEKAQSGALRGMIWVGYETDRYMRGSAGDWDDNYSMLGAIEMLRVSIVNSIKNSSHYVDIPPDEEG